VTEKAIVHQWNLEWEAPRVAIIPSGNPKQSVRWLATEEADQPLLLATTANSYTLGYLEPENGSSHCRFINIAAMEGGDTSPTKGIDSPTKEVTDLFDESVISEQGQDSVNGSMEDVDDTFHYRRHVPVLG